MTKCERCGEADCIICIGCGWHWPRHNLDKDAVFHTCWACPNHYKRLPAPTTPNPESEVKDVAN